MFSDISAGIVKGVLQAFAQLAPTLHAIEQLGALWEDDETDGVIGEQLEELHRLSPAAFERWVGNRFLERGYRVRLTGTHGTHGDHGVDMVAMKPGEQAVVQCKNYRAWAVGEPVLRDLYGVMRASRADKAYLVTTGRVTHAAWRWARGKPIEIWDAATITRLAREAPVTQVAGEQAAQGRDSRLRAAGTSPNPAATCPRCGARLVARRNRTSGDWFLGCSRFPACRHTAPMMTAHIR